MRLRRSFEVYETYTRTIVFLRFFSSSVFHDDV